MTREQAINYLISRGLTQEQVGDVVRALTYEPTTKNDLEIVIDAMEYRTNVLIENIKSEILHFANAHCSDDDINIYDVFKVIDDCCEGENSTTKNDCEHCSKTYGTLGCCDFVSNEPVYSCKEGHEEYARGIRKLGSTTKNNLGVEEVTALAEWTEKLTKECEEAYNKGYADGMKAQEPKTGEWIEHFDESGKWYECDQCHTDWGGAVNFCPNCGADMREVKE